MGLHPLARIVAVVLSFATVVASAATVFEGDRIDARTGKPDLTIQVTTDRGMVRADVLLQDQLQMSIIETNERLVFINHIARSYVVRQAARAAGSAAATGWRTTARRQFALGAYCQIVEVPVSDSSMQEHCLIDANQLTGIAEVKGGAMGVSGFLAAVAQHAEPTTLFDHVVGSATSRTVNSFPLLVRTLENGVAQRELRLLRVTSVWAKNGFEIPSGFREQPISRADTQQAARAQ